MRLQKKFLRFTEAWLSKDKLVGADFRLHKFIYKEHENSKK